MSIIPDAMSTMSLDLPTLEDASDSEEKHRARLRQQLSATSSRLRAFTEWIISGAQAESSSQDPGRQETKEKLERLGEELQSQLELLGTASKLENLEDKVLFEETRANITVLWNEYQRHAFILVDRKTKTTKEQPTPRGSG